MKAVQINKYSKEMQLHINDIDIPEIKDNEVLIKVSTAAVNPLDRLIMTGEVKLIQNYQFPLTLGNELTGYVERTGSKVTRLKTGDRVFSRLPVNQIGAFAEYAAVPETAAALVPEYLSDVEASAVPLTGLTAYQALHEILNAQSGKTLFIPGGTGGFGQMAVPLAKAHGLKVIVSGNVKMKDDLTRLGLDQFIDYKTENYWEILKDVDYVIDTLGAGEFDHELSVIKPGGKLLSLKTAPNKSFAKKKEMSKAKQLLFGFAGAKYDRKAAKKKVSYDFMFVEADGTSLDDISMILKEHNVRPTIDHHVFKLEDAAEAFKYALDGHPTGKVIIKVMNG